MSFDLLFLPPPYAARPRRCPVPRGRRAALAAALLSVSLAGSALHAQKPLERVKELTGTADFVFRGTVVKTGAANLEVVVADAATAVVRVDEVLRAPATLGRFDGREVTVFLDRSAATAAGEGGTFFTRLGLYGETLGVVEVGRLQGDAAALRSAVAAAARELGEDDLRARLAAAEIAVSGRIAAIRPVEAKVDHSSEHDAEWWEAVIEVTAVLKGAPGRTVTFQFPRSLDVMWSEAPRPRVGDEGTWLLRRGEVEGAGDRLTALKPQDLLTPSEAASVKKGGIR